MDIDRIGLLVTIMVSFHVSSAVQQTKPVTKTYKISKRKNKILLTQKEGDLWATLQLCHKGCKGPIRRVCCKWQSDQV